MYVTVLVVITSSLVSTSAFKEFCNKNVTLNKHVSMTMDRALREELLKHGACRFVVRPSHKDMLMAVVVDTSFDRNILNNSHAMCRNIINITHHGNTYHFCHKELKTLPAMDDEVVIELRDHSYFYESGHHVSLKMTPFYPTQCQLYEGAEMCARSDDPDVCHFIKLVRIDSNHMEIPLDPNTTACTEQQAQDCPHTCGLCSAGTAGACCFNEGHTRGELEVGTNGSADGIQVNSMRICDSHPYGCIKHHDREECEYSCEVGQANGPYCVAVIRQRQQERQTDPLRGWGVGGGSGGLYGGMGNTGGGMYGGGLFGGNIGGCINCDADSDGVDGDDGAKKSDLDDDTAKTAAGGKEVGGKWAVVAGVILVLKA